MTAQGDPESTWSQRWLARLSFVLAGLAVVVVVVVAELRSIAMLALGVVAAVISLAAAYVFLSRRGLLRWLALVAFAAAPAAVIAAYAFTGLLWVALVSAAAWLAASLAARGRWRAAGRTCGCPNGLRRRRPPVRT